MGLLFCMQISCRSVTETRAKGLTWKHGEKEGLNGSGNGFLLCGWLHMGYYCSMPVSSDPDEAVEETLDPAYMYV